MKSNCQLVGAEDARNSQQGNQIEYKHTIDLQKETRKNLQVSTNVPKTRSRSKSLKKKNRKKKQNFSLI